jgi:hypothetical protein
MPKIVVPVTLDATTFSRFAVFDTLVLKKHWRSPVLFAAIMVGFALIAYTQTGKIDGAAMLATVLLVVGLVMPTGYFIRFFQSIRIQVKKAGLESPKLAYTLTLEDDNIHVSAANGQEADYKWTHIYRVFRGKGCAYLYVTPSRAFLLPEKAIGDNSKFLWQKAEQYGKV